MMVLTGIPMGLEYLAYVDTLYVHQELELLESEQLMKNIKFLFSVNYQNPKCLNMLNRLNHSFHGIGV